MQKNIKCREYNACFNTCLECDLISNKQCDKKFNFEIPKKFISVERNDHCNMGWNECPICGKDIGYHPDIKNYRCERCGQKIAWS